MAKDPAFLFYPNDFDCATKFFTHEQVGKYIRLLIAQHQHGPLTLEQANFIAGPLDPLILSKFEKSEIGLLYNKRLSLELEKRKKYVESRRSNKINSLSKKHISYDKSYDTTYDTHMIHHMENENEDVNRDKDINENKRDREIESVERKREREITFPTEVFNLYNTFNFPKALKLTKPRINSILKLSASEKMGVEEWRQYFSKASESDFLTGKTKSERKWLADLDWLLNLTNLTKVMEGRYDNRNGQYDGIKDYIKTTAAGSDSETGASDENPFSWIRDFKRTSSADGN